MAVIRYDILGNPNIGVFSLATDKFVIMPTNVPKTKIEKIKRYLNVEKVILTNVGGSLLIGVLTVANSHGIVLPYFAYEEDVKALRLTLKDVVVERLRCKKTAFGNLVLANDYGAVADPRLTSDVIRMLTDILGVEVVPGEVAGLPYVGSLAIATNKGVLAHPLLKEGEGKTLAGVLKVPVSVGTVNGGSPLVGAGIIANRYGATVGSLTTGPEIVMVGQALEVIAS